MWPWPPPLPQRQGSMDEDLQRAAWQGQFGFAFDVQQNSPALQQGTPDLISFNLATHHARAWTVHLNAFRFHGGTLTSGNTQPTDNQTNTAGLAQVKLTFGVDTALETAFADYPARGCTFQVSGSMLRLSLASIFNWPAGGAGPQLSGFVVPCNGSGEPKMPGFTLGRQTLPAGNVLDHPIPARAVGYRYNPVTRTGVAALVSLEQIEPLMLTAVQHDGTFTLVAANAILVQSEAAPMYFPIARDAQYVRVTADAGNTNALTYTLTFVLDLG